jgi:hypothetical protein
MKKLRFRQWVFTLAAPAAALALIVASCAQQSESPVAPSAVRSGGTLFGDTGGGDPTPDPTGEPSPDPTPEPTGEPCSPGYWKNHLDHFYSVCSAAAALSPSDPFASCSDLLTALTCQGSDASCHRSAAAAALNTVSGCTED